MQDRIINQHCHYHEKSIKHLPPSKQKELKDVVSIIRDGCDDVEMIILFGSYARGNYKEEADLKPDRRSGHKSDYDIFVVSKEKSTSKNTRLWREITGKCGGAGLSTHVRIIAHDIQYLNIQLAEGQYLFRDIRKEGCLLHDSGNFKLARKRVLRPEEEKRIAQDYFNHWFEKTNVFFEDFKSNFKKASKGHKYLNQAAFMLHQTTESSYKTILLVLSGENPNEHYLSLLSEMAVEQDEAFSGIFPMESRKEEDLFNLLDCAYIGGRFEPDYRILKEDLEYLSGRVKILFFW